jgi:hypothetical protein
MAQTIQEGSTGEAVRKAQYRIRTLSRQRTIRLHPGTRSIKRPRPSLNGGGLAGDL